MRKLSLNIVCEWLCIIVLACNFSVHVFRRIPARVDVAVSLCGFAAPRSLIGPRPAARAAVGSDRVLVLSCAIMKVGGEAEVDVKVENNEMKLI